MEMDWFVEMRLAVARGMGMGYYSYEVMSGIVEFEHPVEPLLMPIVLVEQVEQAELVEPEKLVLLELPEQEPEEPMRRVEEEV